MSNNFEKSGDKERVASAIAEINSHITLLDEEYRPHLKHPRDIAVLDLRIGRLRDLLQILNNEDFADKGLVAWNGEKDRLLDYETGLTSRILARPKLGGKVVIT